MASTFLINPDPKVYEVVNHINHITTDNNLSNLNFVTRCENSNKQNGTCSNKKPKDKSKLTNYIALDDLGNEVFRITKEKETNPDNYKLGEIVKSIADKRKYRGYYWKVENIARIEFYKRINCTGNINDYSWESHSIYPNLYVCREGFISYKDKILGSLSIEGYIYVNVGDSFKNGRAAHRIIMEHILKRKLKPDEIVDHINTVRTDNSFDNLRLTDWTGNANNPITVQKFKKKVLLVDLYGDFICYDEREELLKIIFPDDPEKWNDGNRICGSVKYDRQHKVTHRITNNNYLVIRDLDTANQSILETIQEEIMYVFDREGNLIDALGTGNILKQLEEKYKIDCTTAYESVKYNRYTRKGFKFVKGGNIIEILKSLGHLTALNFKPEEDTNKKDNN